MENKCGNNCNCQHYIKIIPNRYYINIAHFVFFFLFFIIRCNQSTTRLDFVRFDCVLGLYSVRRLSNLRRLEW